MSDEALGLEFARYAWGGRKLVATACSVALLLAGLAGVLLPKQYTATASILIEPPSGNDPRSSVALSQVYLESLKTYEQFAAGDTLFLSALEDLHLRAQFADTSLETLKRRILTVSRPTNATYIQIAVTLNNAKDAQRLAQYIAERAVALNDSLDRQTSQAMVQEPQRIFAAAKARRDAAEKAAAQSTQSGSLEALEKEYGSVADLRTEVGRDLARARADLANYIGQTEALAPITPGSASPRASNNEWVQYEISATRSRVQDLENQERKLLAFLNEKGSLLEQMKSVRESIESELKAARTEEETAGARLSDIQISEPFRGVRLKVLDPGIVPQKPSFPNNPLNLAIAFALAMLLSLGYLALRFAQHATGHAAERRAPSAGVTDYSWR